MKNTIQLIGYVATAPVLRTVNSPNGPADVCDFNIATNDWRQGKRADGSVNSQFFRVSVWNEAAKSCAQYLTVGRCVNVEGCCVLNHSAANGRDYYNMEVQRANVTFLPSRNDDAQNSAVPAQAAQPVAPARRRPVAAATPAVQPNYDAPMAAATEPMTVVDDDELPF